MIEDTPDDFSPDALFLMGLLDDHIPDRCAIDKVGEYSAEPDETTSIPRTKSQVGMTQHFLCIIKRSALGPWGLLEQPQELRGVRGLVMGINDGGLEGWRHLILEYPPDCL